MSFKVGDEVVTTKGCEYYPEGARGFVTTQAGIWGSIILVDFREDERVFVGGDGTRGWFALSSELAHACPIARESAKLAAKVDQLEAEINAWIERMRRGEW